LRFSFLRFPGSPEHLYYLQCLGPAAWPVSSDRDGISDDKDSFDDGGFGEKCLEDNDSDEDFPTPTSSKPSHHAVPPPAFQNNAVPPPAFQNNAVPPAAFQNNAVRPPAFQNNAVRPPAFQTNAVRPPAFPHTAPPPVHPSSAVPPPVLRSAATPPPLHPPPSSQGQILVGGAPPLPPGRPAVAAAPGLGILSVTQLRAIAASRGIDLSDCVEKKDMVAKLTGGLAAAQSASSPESVVSPIPTPSATPPAEPAAASAERSQRPRQSRWSIGPPENSPSAQPFAAIPPIPPPLPSVATPPPLPPVLPSLFMAPPPLPPSSVSRMDEFVANLSRKDGDSQRSAEEIPEPKGHHMEHFLPDHERKKFAMAAKGIRNFDDEKAKLQDDNKGHQLLSKMGWSEGTGLGKKRKGISVPIQAKGSAVGSAGIGACTGQVEVSPNDDMFTMYKKRIALAYRFRPNPLGNPRKEYWTDPNMNAGATKDY
jgi:hypothetical protein